MLSLLSCGMLNTINISASGMKLQVFRNANPALPCLGTEKATDQAPALAIFPLEV
ncbi:MULTISPECIES: hypothetical protein [Aquitalea]|uniref:hypothetical protein n=1 Tax=Aquitalea TaxID=407217 RepID=UPI00135BD96C|nr:MULTISPECIES: hypothetical protein [Aquitalea]